MTEEEGSNRPQTVSAAWWTSPRDSESWRPPAVNGGGRELEEAPVEWDSESLSSLESIFPAEEVGVSGPPVQTEIRTPGERVGRVDLSHEWEPEAADWHWVGEVDTAQKKLREALRGGRGPELVLVTDGGLQGKAAPRLGNSGWQLTTKGSCGWVLGTGSTLGSRGEGVEEPRLIAEGGGVEEHRGWGADSSYRSELWGVVSALRMLNHWSKQGEGSGLVHHWADNMGVVSMLNHLVGGGNMRWSGRNNRDLWGEVRGRLRHWLARGGSWSSQWVKGHQDTTNTQGEEYSLATRMNIRADALATMQLNAVLPPPLRTVPGVNTQMPGGDWVGSVGTEGEERRWLDGIDSELDGHLRERNLSSYWRNRLEGRADSEEHSLRLWAEHPVPCIDRRLKLSSGGGREKNRTNTIFRTKLWWDHLPSQGVRLRGERLTESQLEDTPCDLCDEKQTGGGNTWHILGECLHPSLRSAREEATDGVWVEVQKMMADSSTRRELGARWLSALVLEGGKWSRPAGWGVGYRTAGTVSNPWYGLFPPSWLDGWCAAHDDSALTYHQGVGTLRKLCGIMLDACRRVWRAAAVVWLDKRRGMKEREERELLRAARAERAEQLRRARGGVVASSRGTVRGGIITEGWVFKAQKAVKREAERVKLLTSPVPGRVKRVLGWEEWERPRLLEWYEAFERQRRLRRRRAKSRVALARQNKRVTEEQMAGGRLRRWLEGGQGATRARCREGQRAGGGTGGGSGSRQSSSHGGGAAHQLTQTTLQACFSAALSGVAANGGASGNPGRRTGGRRDGRTVSRKTRQARWATL
jgi:hypothetical protein